MTDAPPCSRCKRPMRFESRFKLDHESGDSPGMTMMLVPFLEDLRRSGMADTIGAEVVMWVCDPCDIGEAFFSYPNEEDQ